MKDLSSHRILYLDYARSIALFLVVFAHLYSVDSSVKLYVYAFHMPFFFLVSGILHKQEEFMLLLKKMAKRMLIPFCFFLFIGYMYCAISSRSLSVKSIYGSMVGVFCGKDIVANDILWFLIALFWVRILGNWFISNPKVALPILVVCSCLAYGLHINYFYIGTSLMALPFYLFGYYAREGISKMVTTRWHLLFSLLLFAISVLISNYNGKVSMMCCSFGRASIFPLRYFLFYINGLIGSVAILCLVGKLKKKYSLASETIVLRYKYSGTTVYPYNDLV